ncbi:MAG: hypothetical protein QOG52_1666 [Frankiaceae bacterium]|nr:hypothetical protein [Frankiaceae bacterium]
MRARRVVRSLGWLATLTGLAWGATRYGNSGNQLVAVPAAFVPFAIVPAVVGAGLLAGVRSRWGTAAGVLVVLLVGATQVPLYAGSPSGPVNARPLTVLTLNMEFGLADANALVAAAVHEGADVVALEEMTPEALDRLNAAGMAGAFPYSIVAPGAGAGGVGLFSRHPLLGAGTAHEWVLGAVSASVDLGAGYPAPRVFAVHVPAPWPQHDGKWRAQLASIPPLLSADRRPVVMAGDFNSTMDHEPFRAMLRDGGLSDAATSTGAGWLRTFPADRAFPPLIAIDHVLTRGAGASEVHTVTVHGTDHRGIVAVVQVPHQ